MPSSPTNWQTNSGTWVATIMWVSSFLSDNSQRLKSRKPQILQPQPYHWLPIYLRLQNGPTHCWQIRKWYHCGWACLRMSWCAQPLTSAYKHTQQSKKTRVCVCRDEYNTTGLFVSIMCEHVCLILLLFYAFFYLVCTGGIDTFNSLQWQ